MEDEPYKYASHPEGAKPNGEPASDLPPGGTGQPDKHRPPEDAATGHRKRQQGSRGDASAWAMVVVTAIGTVILLVYTCATLGLLTESQKATKAARRSAKTAAKQLEYSDRPWIRAEPIVRKPLRLENGAARLDVDFRVVNAGKSVAHGVHPLSKLYVGDPRNLKQWYAEQCDPLRSTPMDAPGTYQGTMLFPEDDFTTRDALEVDAVTLAAAPRMAPNISGDGLFTVVTCVNYTFTRSGSAHQTRYVFVVGTQGDGGQSLLSGILPGDAPTLNSARGDSLLLAPLGSSAD